MEKGTNTLSQETMKKAMQKYLDGFNQGNAHAIISLFAENARIEDPVGGKAVEGKEAITTFYRRGVEVVDRLELEAPIRGSYGRSAAMAFKIYMLQDGKDICIRSIDVMTFSDSGKIIDMKAYHGPDDLREQ